MNYRKTLNYIMDQLPMYQRIGNAAYRSGLDNTLKLDAHFGNPHRQFKTIHVAGTNGKGSVSHMLASVLQEAGYKTGLYTSPHLVDFRERIRINGTMITKKFVAEFITKNQAYFSTFNPSFFEISVFMAFEYFVQNQVDIAVIEVGLGGRLDATNIISPRLSVITNIGKDHMEILGDTLQKIAAEKAGIIKPDTPCVIGEKQTEIMAVFREKTRQQNSKTILADEQYAINYSLTSADGFQVFNVKKKDEIRFANLKCGLMGHYQRKNTATVLAAVDELIEDGLQIQEKDIYNGIRKVVQNTGLMGRWQVVRVNPVVICDTAHNPDGMRVLMQQVAETAKKNFHLIIGFVNDKDIPETLKYLPADAHFYFTRLSVPRTMDENELMKKAGSLGFAGQSYSHVKAAYDEVLQRTGSNDLVLITGSNFLVADFLIMISETS
ncbi:MAG: bifunctional folylpolyglutamate synthase/dihydrofolate synthase [Prolixibacteraceae bacterium]|nr:bifunctional folylpolyglutamate synthase/dihydrofolate synthase [Prolixibacteraceae bacterium]